MQTIQSINQSLYFATKHVQVSNNKANQYGWTTRRCTYGLFWLISIWMKSCTLNIKISQGTCRAADLKRDSTIKSSFLSSSQNAKVKELLKSVDFPVVMRVCVSASWLHTTKIIHRIIYCSKIYSYQYNVVIKRKLLY